MSRNNDNNTAPRVSRAVPSKNLNIGLIIKHELANIRKKVGKGIFIRYNDERAPGNNWYLEAYLDESLDLAQNLLLQAEKKYLQASQPRPQPRTRPKKASKAPAAPTHQNQFSTLADIDQKKQAKKQVKNQFEENFPSLDGPAPQPAPRTGAPVWVKDSPKPKIISKKTPSVDTTPRILLKPKTQPIKISKIRPIAGDWETAEPTPLTTAVPDAWDDGDWYDQIPGAH